MSQDEIDEHRVRSTECATGEEIANSVGGTLVLGPRFGHSSQHFFYYWSLFVRSAMDEVTHDRIPRLLLHQSPRVQKRRKKVRYMIISF